MTRQRKFTAEFKARVVLELIADQKSLAQASRDYGIKDSLLSRWKQQFIERSPMLFQLRSNRDDRDQRIADLERLLGCLALEIDMTKKASSYLSSGRNGNAEDT